MRVLAWTNTDAVVRYGPDPGSLAGSGTSVVLRCGVPSDVVIDGLAPDSAYQYRLSARAVTGTDGTPLREDGRFHTQRAPGRSFVFTVTADSHLDDNTTADIYLQTLRNALGDGPDFHIDLGDTFMTGKRRDRPEDALPQYLAQRYYFGQLCHSAALFLVLGNHDGESVPSMACATRMRTLYFPNPRPDAFYTGSADQNYYAWRWGDVLCIVLDPFRYAASEGPRRADDAWGLTLGRVQYDWLWSCLQSSEAPLRMVFVHNLVGGADTQGRGGAEAVGFGEWGGCSHDGSAAFHAKRPGWPMPIHDLLVKGGVAVVFHGHDHFFARQARDGIVYQLVPQPGHPGEGSIRQAAAYGYQDGVFCPGAGYLRVAVAASTATVAYVRTVPGESNPGNVLDRYTVIARPSTIPAH